jgi:hypothetical protein
MKQALIWGNGTGANWKGSLNRLLKKSRSTPNLGCARIVSAAKPAQARVPVLQKPSRK